jgi:hypothetical protein
MSTSRSLSDLEDEEAAREGGREGGEAGRWKGIHRFRLIPNERRRKGRAK